METKLMQFLVNYLGVANVGDTAENSGQCVGLIEVWLDALIKPHIWGNAKDLIANADPAHYLTVANGPTNAPPAGAIVVWGPIWGGGDGHCAVAIAGNVMHFACFEQNDPDGAPCLVATHVYAGVVGWIIPR